MDGNFISLHLGTLWRISGISVHPAASRSHEIGVNFCYLGKLLPLAFRDPFDAVG
jgi:hypothetical protein